MKFSLELRPHRKCELCRMIVKIKLINELKEILFTPISAINNKSDPLIACVHNGTLAARRVSVSK